MSSSDDTSRAFYKGVTLVVATPFLIGLGALAGSFPIMIALGIWHHEIDPRVPALGFWPVLGISWGLGALVTKFRAKYRIEDAKVKRDR